MSEFVRSVLVPLTDEELIAVGKEVAMKADELDKLKEDRKRTAKEYREDIKAMEGDLDELHRQLRIGTKTVDHRFDWRISPDTGRASLVDLDSGDVVEERDAYPHELAPDGAADKTEQALAPLPEPEQMELPGVEQ